MIGALLVCLGALSGAFGTIAWLTALCARTLPSMLVGMVSLGLVPVLGGGAMLWAGLGVLETQAARARVRDLPEPRIIEAVSTGGTVEAIADRLGMTDARELEDRLDALVAREILTLEIDGDGALVYCQRC